MTAGEQYQRAYALHYYEFNVEAAIPIYRDIVATHPDDESAKWAQTQLENIENYTPSELARYSKQRRQIYDPARGQCNQPQPMMRNDSADESGCPESLLSRMTDTASRFQQSSNNSQTLVLALGAPVVLSLLGYGIMLMLYDGPPSIEQSWLGWLLIVTVILIFEWLWLRSPINK